MSSLAVRTAFMRELPSRLGGVSFYETVNKEPPRIPPLPNVWVTAFFQVTTRLPVTMGVNPWIEEQGTISLIVFSKSGTGYEQAVTTASNLMHAFDGWVSSADYPEDVWFESVNAPSQLLPETPGEWLMISVDCRYRSQERNS